MYYEPVSWSPKDDKILCNVGVWSRRERIVIIDLKSRAITDVTAFDPDNASSYAVSWQRR